MFKVRLMGLMLFVTAVLLALAAAATKTTHVTISSAWHHNQATGSGPNSTVTSPGVSAQLPVEPGSIPIVWPLLGTAAVGLLLWFIQPSRSKPLHSRPRTRRRR